MKVRETESTFLKGKERVTKGCWQEQSSKKPSVVCWGAQWSMGAKGDCQSCVWQPQHWDENWHKHSQDKAFSVCGHSDACLLFCYITLALVKMLWEWFHRGNNRCWGPEIHVHVSAVQCFKQVLVPSHTMTAHWLEYLFPFGLIGCSPVYADH